jgi:GntR family transcriptional repressor for pyruvate dehydrogenase complex
MNDASMVVLVLPRIAMNRDNYQRIRPKKISDEIVGQIKTLIKTGKLQPGEQLPPERALAELFGVGRPTLREALNHLEALEIVEIRKRQGVFVGNIGSTLVSDSLSRVFKEDRGMLPYLYEMRKDIEIAAARLAAQRRTDEDLTTIFRPIEKMENDLKVVGFSIANDIDFHMAVARATHNFLRVHIMQHLFDISNEFLERVRTRLGRRSEDLSVVVNHHRRVFEAIRDRDGPKAGMAMEHHLAWVERQWLRVINEDRRQSG